MSVNHSIWCTMPIRITKEQLDKVLPQIRVDGNPIVADVELVKGYVEFEIEFPISGTVSIVSGENGQVLHE